MNLIDVPLVGLEPTRPSGHQGLSLKRAAKFRHRDMVCVGEDGIEPSTSCVSDMCSNPTELLTHKVWNIRSLYSNYNPSTTAVPAHAGRLLFVPSVGLEPTRPSGHRALNTARATNFATKVCWRFLPTYQRAGLGFSGPPKFLVPMGRLELPRPFGH